MKTPSRTLIALLGLALVTGAAAAAAAASNRSPSLRLLSWHRNGKTEYVTLLLCGTPGAQSIRITESGVGLPRRLTFATRTDSEACAPRNVYWDAKSGPKRRTTITVQVRGANGALSPVLRRSQLI